MTSTKRALSAKGMQHQWIPSRTSLWWWSWENNSVTRTFLSKHLNRAGGKRSSFLPTFVFRPIVWVENSFRTSDYKRLAGWQSFTFALLDSALPCKHTCEVLWLLLTSHGKFFTPLWYIEYVIFTISSFCSSGQMFAASFPQIPFCNGQPCSWLYTSRYRACYGLAPVRECSCWANKRKPPTIQ